MRLRGVRCPEGRVVDFEWVYANASTERWLGGEGLRLNGRRLLAVAPWAGSCGLFDACVRALERRVPDMERFVRPAEAGRCRHFAARMAPGDDGVDLFVEELAGRASTEALLRREHELLHALVQASTDAIYVKDLVGRYLFVNAAAASALGRTVEALLGRTDAELVGAALASPTLAHDRAVLESGAIATYEEAESGPGLGTLWQSVKGVLRHPDGTAYALFGVCRDVTARRRQEEEREAEGRFRERFIGVLGHDLGNPLAALRLSAAALLARDELAPEVRRVMLRVDGSAERMSRLVKQLLDFTRARMAGGIPLRPRDTCLDEVARRIIEELEPAYPSREVELEVCGDCRGHWDEERLGQALSNLVANALQNSPEGTPVHVRLEARGAQQRVEVHNAGPPIPEELRARLFEPFLQRPVGPSGRRPGSGLGLGLYIVSQVIQAHGGRVEVRSTQEAGTCFTVTLPRGMPTSGGREAEPLSAFPAGRVAS
ncbi:ATP-binding protein [Myxococcaceae bacterium GXIMD 01537]